MWEEIDAWSARLKVPDGWLVRYCVIGVSVAMVFIKDKSHKWILEEEEEE